MTHLCCNGHSTRDQQVGVGGFGGHHAELGRLDEIAEVLDLGCGVRFIFVLLLVSVLVSLLGGVILESVLEG
jgi:hypothetical protein